MNVHGEFEGGNVEGVEILAPDHVRVRARADGSPRPLWFFFCIEDASAPSVRVDLANADDCLGPRLGWQSARPVFSADAAHWARVARTHYVQETETCGYFDFQVPVVGRHTYVAYCYPYTTHDLARFLDLLVRRPGVEVGTLCRSDEGRVVPRVRVGTADRPRHGVWLLARQHAGETPGSFVAEGLLDWLTGEDPLAADLRQQTALHAVPMVDVDGVFLGRYGKDAPPIDFNRDWSPAPARPQTAALVREIEGWAAAHPYDLLIDLHAPHHGESACYLFGSDTAEEAGRSDARRRFAELLAAEAPPEIDLRPDAIRQRDPPPGSAREYQAQAHGVLVLCTEISYHFARSNALMTPDLYRRLGAAMGRALQRWLLP